jgi:hypothetical protein
MADIAAEKPERIEQEETKLLVDISSLDFKGVLVSSFWIAIISTA